MRTTSTVFCDRYRVQNIFEKTIEKPRRVDVVAHMPCLIFYCTTVLSHDQFNFMFTILPNGRWGFQYRLENM